MSTMISVDIGLNALGWASWDWSRGKRKKFIGPLSAGVITVPTKLRQAHPQHEDWWERLRWLMGEFSYVMDTNDVKKVALEYPEFRGASAMGLAAAARSDLTGLAMCAGAHAQQAWAMGIDAQLVTVTAWKGSLPKKIVEKRIANAIGSSAEDGSEFKTHAWDAVGIGLYAKGYPMDADEFRTR